MNSKQIPAIMTMGIMLVAMFFMFRMSGQQNNVAPPAAPAAYEQAYKAEQRAGNSTRELKKVLQSYQRIASTYGKDTSPEAKDVVAKARLQIGIINETKLNNKYAAVESLSLVVKDYSRSTDIGRVAWQHLEDIDRSNSHTAYYKVIDFLVKLTGKHPAYSYFLALLMITLVFKLLTTPLSHMQFKSMKEMQKIQPLVKQLQDQYKGDQKTLGEKTMALYKEHSVNPFSGCLPMLIQLPLLILLYNVVRAYQVQFLDGRFLWIGSSLAAKYPGIVAANLALPDIALLVIYTISMILSQKLTMVVTDPTQAEQQKMMMYTMPLIFAFIFYKFPSAFMLYWLLFNIISTVQQYYIMKQIEDGGSASGGTTSGGGVIEPKKQVIAKSTPATAPAKRRKKKFDRVDNPTPALNPSR